MNKDKVTSNQITIRHRTIYRIHTWFASLENVISFPSRICFLFYLKRDNTFKPSSFPLPKADKSLRDGCIQMRSRQEGECTIGCGAFLQSYPKSEGRRGICVLQRIDGEEKLQERKRIYQKCSKK